MPYYTDKQLLKDYYARMPIDKLLKKHKISRSGFYKKLERLDVTLHNEKLEQEDIDLVVKLFKKYGNQHRIVSETGFTKQKVSRILKIWRGE